MAYSDNFPATRPVFMADFANGGKIDPRATFSRASTGTFFGTDKALSSENLLTYSNPNNAAWNESNGASVSTNSAASPDGTTTASSIIEDSANSQHRTFASINATSGQEYTLVAYLKGNGRTIAQVATSGASAAANVEFDLSGSGTATTRSGSPTNSSISQIGSTGWYKCSFQVTAGSTATLYLNVYLCDSANSNSYTGDGSSGVYAYGFNLSTTGQLVHEDTSGQVARNYQTKLQTAASGAARFEHSTDGQSAAKGILIEGQSTNLVTYSENSTQWSDPYSDSYANSAIAPDGTLTATYWVPDATSQPHYLYHGTVSVTSGTTYTGSVFIKGVNNSRAQLTFGGAGFAGGYVNFSLSGSGSVLTEQAGASGTISSCGNGWYRVTVTAAADATTSTAGVLVASITNDNEARLVTYTPNGYDGLLVWGFQMEASSHSSSYLKSNSGSTTTRAAESLSVATADIGYTGGPVALFAESSTQSPAENSNNRGVVDLSEPTTSNNRVMIYNRGAQAGGFFVNADNVQQGAGFGGITDDSYSKVAVSVDTNSVKHCVNGGTVTTDTSAVIPEGMTKLFIGQTRSGSGFGGHIKRLAIYPALSDTNLQALTS